MRQEEIYRQRFLSRLWAARKQTHADRFKKSQAKYEEATTYALRKNLHDAAFVAQAAWLQLKKMPREASTLLETFVASSTQDSPFYGLTCFFLASMYRDLHLFDKALEYNKRSLECRFFDRKLWAINNIGEIHSALAAQKSDDLAAFLKHLKEAKKHYQKALDPSDDTDYITHYNLGLVNSRLAQLESGTQARQIMRKAIGHFEYALQNCLTNKLYAYMILRELGTAHYLLASVSSLNQDILQLSREVWDRSLAFFEVNAHEICSDLEFAHPDSQGFQKTAEERSIIIREKVHLISERSADTWTTDDRIVLAWMPDSVTPASGLYHNEERLYSRMQVEALDVYNSLINRPEFSNYHPGGVFSVLRGWASTVPLVLGHVDGMRGGGYYFEYGGYGFAIDPGFGFVQNFLADDQNHPRTMIGVFVTHNHPDHNSDLDDLDNIRYELYKRAPASERESWGYTIWGDLDTCKERDDKRQTYARGIRDWYSAVNVVRLLPKQDKTSITIDLPKIIHRSKHRLKVYYADVKHDQNLTNALCFRFAIEQKRGNAWKEVFVLSYTGDCEYEDRVADFLAPCDLLLAHMSQPSRGELLSTRRERMKESHLGFRGVHLLSNRVASQSGDRLKMVLVGEFWGGRGDIRREAIGALENRIKGPRVLAAGLGLKIDIPSCFVVCTLCKQLEEPLGVNCVVSREFDRMLYICRRCQGP